MKQEHEMTPGVLVSGDDMSAGDYKARCAVLEAEVAELRRRVCVPEGYVVVPVEPTEDMRRAGFVAVERADGCYNHDESDECPHCGDGFGKPDGCGSRAVIGYRAMISAAPAPVERVEQESEDLDSRLREAGMYSVADLLRGAPLDGFIKHAGVHDIESLVKWAEMRRAECLIALARYDLGDKSKNDELYEWTVAHCAVFAELHVNLRAATEAPQPAPTAAPSRDVIRATLMAHGFTIKEGQTDLKPYVYEAVEALFADAAPTAAQDVAGLVEALKALLARDQRNTCLHESTHRGGAIWEICDECGAKWSDDRDPKPEWVDPPEWTRAEELIAAHQSGGAK